MHAGPCRVVGARTPEGGRKEALGDPGPAEAVPCGLETCPG